MTRSNRIAPLLTFAAVAMATLVVPSTSAHAQAVSATGWNVDFILGSGETWATNQHPENNNIWFAENSTVGVLGLPASGGVNVSGKDFQLQPYGGGTNNVLRSTAATNTLTLDVPGMFSDISVLGSNTGGTAGAAWELALNFSDGPSSGAIVYSAFGNWAGSGPGLNPTLTGNGTTNAFGGQLNVIDLDLDALGFSGLTLESIDFSNTAGAGGNLAVFGLAGNRVAAAAVPEPASIAIWLLIGLGLAGFGYSRIRRKK